MWFFLFLVVLFLSLVWYRLSCWRGRFFNSPLLQRFVIVAHRGITTHAHENTLESVTAASPLNCDFLELDVRLTRYGELILFHDKNLERITSSNGPVESLTPEKRQQVKIISRYNSIPAANISTVKEILTSLPSKVGLILEIKNHRILSWKFEKSLSRVLREINTRNLLIISSFNPISLWKIKILARNLPTAFVWSEEDTPSFLPIKLTIRLLHPDMLHPEYTLINDSILKLARKHSLPLYVWTVNDLTIARKLQKMGINGIFTDKPEEMKGYFT